MLAYEFLAHDISGLTLSGVTDDGMCEWIGTQEQWANADMQVFYFQENGHFYLPTDEQHEKHVWDAEHGN